MFWTANPEIFWNIAVRKVTINKITRTRFNPDTVIGARVFICNFCQNNVVTQ